MLVRNHGGSNAMITVMLELLEPERTGASVCAALVPATTLKLSSIIEPDLTLLIAPSFQCSSNNKNHLQGGSLILFIRSGLQT